MCESASVLLRIESDADDASLDKASTNLVAQLRASGLVENVHPIMASAPVHSKSYEAITLGAFALAIAPTLIPELLAMIKNWLYLRSHKEKVVVEVKRGSNSTHIEYRPGDMSTEDIEQLVKTLSVTNGSG